MKKALLIAAVTVLSTTAYASKARRTALADSPHLNDVQDIHTKPDRAATYGEWATVEFGATGTGTSEDVAAEGGFVRQSGQTAWGAYVGQASESVEDLRDLADSLDGGGVDAFLSQENPLRVFYAQKADMNWGVGLLYSKS